jgi:hypothetical protein
LTGFIRAVAASIFPRRHRHHFRIYRVLRKCLGAMAPICWLMDKPLHECRCALRSALQSRLTGMASQKPIAIAGVDGNHGRNGGGATIVKRVFAAGGMG